MQTCIVSLPSVGVFYDQPQPTTTRRRLAFMNARFDGTDTLDSLTDT